MAYPVYTKNDLADFSGRPVASYTSYSTQSLAQALLLFKIGTCLADIPNDPISQELSQMAILSMADAVYLGQQYQKESASPFTSETIGSYSYTKAVKAVANGEQTGIMWFDLAVEKMSVCEDTDNIPFSGGIEVFEHDGKFVTGALGNSNTRFLSPDDLNKSRDFGYDFISAEFVTPSVIEVDLEEDPDNPGLYIP